ncbi:hypothetical protein E1B28_013242 [Marasmius oreades]|uniref:Uncharacterized protein n=1 Tax=Marasmius oreades TaxID=181124 RepID=A0A9P7RQ12_9AGAR|nr:uncharacterized protein E1B28_013242 [Marasmius oreades]KAG7087263.1 hypothetical protein E1B28_013242 [Marasmius oreades]
MTDAIHTGTYTYECCIEAEDTNLLSSFIRQGLLPCAPSQPSVAITIRTMEAYRTMFMRSPHFTIQPFVKALCDIHGIPFRSYLTQQFSICFDLFFAILADVRALVEQKLERHSETWRLQNACPCCTYRLEGEKELNYSMLFTMDGNDSLKRIARRNAGEQGQLGASKERLDSREGGGGYFLSREEVDEWSKGMLEEILAASDEGTGGNEVNPCADRWKNMMQEMVARMWGIFDETGVFLSLCRHGFVLLACDMVRSGELAKYPLAMVSRLLDVLGKNLGGAYDIGCKFQSTLNKSTIGEKARRLGFKTLVGLFHGHAHNRRCQLKNLLTYVESVGLEDLEGCERFFSRSNALAPAVRHASIFHRRQAISEFCRHLDAFDTLQSLSDFLCNNYYQALDILDGESAWISSMRSFVGKHEADAEELRKLCEDWRKEEQEYLEGLTKTPEVETLQMEYLKTLRRLVKTQENLNLARDMFVNETPDTILNYGTNTANTNAREAQRRHLWELHQLALEDTQVLEKRLEIRERWIPSSVEWKDAEKLVDNMEYQQALDRLEGLIVSRLFELKGMNKAGQGYKLRQHVGKALKSRSHAIQNAVDRYNKAAVKRGRPELDFQTVVDYTFLAEFDLLREGRKDIRDQAWAVPAARNLMDQYYKIERAREEKERLDIEIQRLVTWMQDEEAYLLAKEREVTDPALSYQIQRYRARRTRFNNIHFKKLAKLLKQDGCTATFVAGVGTLSLWRQGSKMAEGTEQEDEEELVEEDIQEEEQVTSTYDDLVLIEGLAALGS